MPVIDIKRHLDIVIFMRYTLRLCLIYVRILTVRFLTEWGSVCMKHTIIFHLIGFARKTQKVIGFKSPPLSLSYSEASAILITDSQKNINQRKPAANLHLDPASVVTLIDKLEKLNLVKRQSPDGDRRKYNIVLTDDGKRKVRLIKKRINQLEKDLRSRLSEEEIASFFPTLEKLMAYLDDWKGLRPDPRSRAVLTSKLLASGSEEASGAVTQRAFGQRGGEHEIPSTKRHLAP